jgi:hypothetical protein
MTANPDPKLHAVAELALDQLRIVRGKEEPVAIEQDGLMAIEHALLALGDSPELFFAVNGLIGIARHLDRDRSSSNAAHAILSVAVKATPRLRTLVDRASDARHHAKEARKKRFDRFAGGPPGPRSAPRQDGAAPQGSVRVAHLKTPPRLR